MTILVSALEISSNIYLKKLKEHLKDIKFIGIFDKSLGSPLYAPEQFCIMGFFDVFKKLLFILKAQKQMLSLAKDANKILMMDSSSFNIPLAKKIKKLYPKKQIIYYILPQIWAWKPWRAKTINKYFDKLIPILPFEILLYEKDKTIFCGHPMLDFILECKKKITKEGPIVYMPGSRVTEIKHLMPYFRSLRSKINKKSILVIPSQHKNKDLNNMYGDISAFDISFDAQNSLLKAEFAFICSGSATLQAALIGTPFVLVYKARKIDYVIAKAFVFLEHIGLANIIFTKMGKNPIHKELLQDDINDCALLSEYENCDKGSFLAYSKILHNYLQKGSSKSVGDVILGKLA